MAVSETISNTYDALHRLTHVQYGNGTSVAYTYDAAGNRLTLVAQEMSGEAPQITETDPQSVVMDEDSSPTPFSLVLHATDDDDDPITWSISSPASHGIAAASGTGLSKSIAYTPTENYNGTDSFVVMVSDGNGGTDTLTINVTIHPRNDAPVNTVPPTVTGTYEAGQTLTADPGTWNDHLDEVPGEITYRYQWWRADNASGANTVIIVGASGNSYTLQTSDRGKYVQVVVHADDDTTTRELPTAWQLVGGIPDLTIDVDGNGTVGIFTDGMLIARHLMGFTGTALTDGVVGNGAQRADASSVGNYIEGMKIDLTLDADDNESVNVFTDGILILRYLIGFRGTTLTDGIIGSGAQRTDPVDIEAYIQSLFP